MTDHSHHDALLPAAVVAVLEAVEKTGPISSAAERDNFAFNVLLNATSTVLERIRAAQPDAFPMYLEMAQLMLRDDP